jgi:hypothetical protein
MPSCNPAKVKYAPKSSAVPLISRIEASDSALKVQWELALYHHYLGGFLTVASTDASAELINITLSAEQLYDEWALIDGLRNGTTYAITVSSVVKVEDDYESDDSDSEGSWTIHDGQEGLLLTSAVKTGIPVGVPNAPKVAVEEDSETVGEAIITVTLSDNNGDIVDSVLINIVDVTVDNAPQLSNQSIRLTAAQQKAGVVEASMEVDAGHKYVIAAIVTNVAGASESSESVTLEIAKEYKPTPTLEIDSVENGLHDDDGNYSLVTVSSTLDSKTAKVENFRVFIKNTLEALEELLADEESTDYVVIGASPTEPKSDVYELKIRQPADYDNTVAAFAIVAVSSEGEVSDAEKKATVFGILADPTLHLGLFPSSGTNEAVQGLYQIFRDAGVYFDKLISNIKSINAANTGFSSNIKPVIQRLLESRLGNNADMIKKIYAGLKGLKPILGDDFVESLGDEDDLDLDTLTANTTYGALWESESRFHLVRVLAVIFQTLRDKKYPTDKALIVVFFDAVKGTGMYNTDLEMRLDVVDKTHSTDLAKDVDVSSSAAWALFCKLEGDDEVEAHVAQTTTMEDSAADLSMLHASAAAKATLSQQRFPAGEATVSGKVPRQLKPIEHLKVIANEKSFIASFDLPEDSCDPIKYMLKIYKASDLKTTPGMAIKKAQPLAELDSAASAAGSADAKTYLVNLLGSSTLLPIAVGGTFSTELDVSTAGKLVVSVTAFDGMCAANEVFSEAFGLDTASAKAPTDLSAELDGSSVVLSWKSPVYSIASKTEYVRFDVLENGEVVGTLDYSKSDEHEHKLTVETDHVPGDATTYWIQAFAEDKSTSTTVTKESELVPVFVVFTAVPVIGAITHSATKGELSVTVSSKGDASPKLFAIIFDKDAQPLILDAFTLGAPDKDGKLTAKETLGDFEPYLNAKSEVAALVTANNAAGQSYKLSAGWADLFA